MTAPLRIVKVGGSLYDLPDLQARLRAYHVYCAWYGQRMPC